MQTQNINLEDSNNPTILKEAGNIIKSGGLVIFPTDTVYGIGANGLNEHAISKIFNIKKRSSDKPIALLISDKEMLPQLCTNISDIENKLMDAFWPGAFTIILNKTSIIPSIVTSNLNSIGVRIPNNKIACEIIKNAGVPLATPSANISGEASGINIDKIKYDFNGKVEMIIDGGTPDLGIASTIVKVIDDIPHILRQGSITPEQIKKITGNIIIDCNN